MSFLPLLATINFALIDLIAFDFLISLLFVIGGSGNITFLADELLGKGEFKNTEWFVFPVIILGLSYFFITNYYQDLIIGWLISNFGWWLLLLLPTLFCFTIFWISRFIVGRKMSFRLCKYLLIAFVVLALLLVVALAITHGN